MPAACPMCRKAAAPRGGENSPWPFCSERCRLIDLGKWLDEDYRIPDGPEGSAATPTEQTNED
jgi:endogenous inhibitor of DNA gyrase (YacG/DUF329 family)